MANALPALAVKSPQPANALLAAAQIGEVQQAQRGRRALASTVAQHGGLPTSRRGQEQFVRSLATGGAPEQAMAFQQQFAQLNAHDQERIRAEGQTVARTLAGVRDQPGYEAALGFLSQRGIDTSRLPPVYHQPTIDTVVNAQRDIEDVVNPPLSFDQQLQLRQAGRSSVTVNTGPTGIDYGDPPKDMAWARNADNTVATQIDPDTGFRRPVAVPIAGGPVEEERAALASAGAEQERQRQLTRDVVTEEIGRVRQAVTESPGTTTGFLGGTVLSNIGGTTARNVRANLDTIRANVGFDRLQQMRDASPTGGALGQVSEQENLLLQSVLGSLEQSQDDEQLLRNLDRLEAIYNTVVHGTPTPQTTVRETAVETPQGAAVERTTTGITEGTTATNPTTGQRIIFRNGRWEPLNG